MLVVCSPGEPEELGAQITTDIAEAHGWTVHFAGGGVPDDEVLQLIGEGKLSLARLRRLDDADARNVERQAGPREVRCRGGRHSSPCRSSSRR